MRNSTSGPRAVDLCSIFEKEIGERCTIVNRVEKASLFNDGGTTEAGGDITIEVYPHDEIFIR